MRFEMLPPPRKVSTVVNFVFIPGLYVLMQRLRGQPKHTPEPEHHDGEEASPAPTP